MSSGNTEPRGRKGSNSGETHPLKERRKEQLHVGQKGLVGWNGPVPLLFSSTQASKVKWEAKSSQTIVQQEYQYVLLL